ncbi:MAG: glycerol-3-phosphate dehydrogenase/oxidase [bacterium]
MSRRDRRTLLERLATDHFDLLVIGGGITGAGVAREAAMRGLRVALVEQQDFASGTSSRSSRLVHGGVRYLEHGQLGLVFESSRERRTLLRIAPHLVRPLSFTWPVYRGARVARWKLAAALTLYDALALFRNVARHARLSATQVRAREPALRSDALLGGAQYWDASTDDARLTLATAQSALAEGGVIVNHAKVTGFVREGERLVGVVVTDTLTGRTLQVRAAIVVNASGPWSDRVERLARTGAADGIRGSKGVHVSVSHERIGNTAALTLIAPQDGRVMFVLPAGEFTIIGTTDTFDDVAPEDVRASVADVTYLLSAANHFFPAAQLTIGDVVSAWAGLRPLAASSAGRSDPGSASREHSIVESEPGLLRVTGGKLTTYRSMAAQVVDVAQRAITGRSTQSRSAIVPLAGGDIADIAGETVAATRATGDEIVAERLVRAHGSAWRDVWALAAADSVLRGRVIADRPYLLAELAYAVHEESACTLGDLLIRRTPIAFETRDHGYAAARYVVAHAATWLHWSAEQAIAALAEFDEESQRIFKINESARVR